MISCRNPNKQAPFEICPEELIEEFLKCAKKYGVEKQPEQPILMGKDLLEYVDPGPRLGKLLEKAYTIQIEEGITDKKELKKRLKI